MSSDLNFIYKNLTLQHTLLRRSKESLLYTHLLYNYSGSLNTRWQKKNYNNKSKSITPVLIVNKHEIISEILWKWPQVRPISSNESEFEISIHGGISVICIHVLCVFIWFIVVSPCLILRFSLVVSTQASIYSPSVQYSFCFLSYMYRPACHLMLRELVLRVTIKMTSFFPEKYVLLTVHTVEFPIVCTIEYISILSSGFYLI